MTAVLLPNGKQQFFTTPGVPAVGYKLATFAAGTSTPQATWVDAGQIGANTNPIILDARGEAVIFWNGAYKVQLQDSTGVVIWTVDNVQSQAPITASFIPSADNTFALGSPSFAWSNVYVGANHAPMFDPTSGNVGYFARTAQELAAGITPSNFSYLPGDVRRYGAVGDGVADDSIPLSNATKTGHRVLGGGPQYTYLYTTTILIPATVTSILADWQGSTLRPSGALAPLIANVNPASAATTTLTAAPAMGTVVFVVNSATGLAVGQICWLSSPNYPSYFGRIKVLAGTTVTLDTAAPVSYTAPPSLVAYPAANFTQKIDWRNYRFDGSSLSVANATLGQCMRWVGAKVVRLADGEFTNFSLPAAASTVVLCETFFCLQVDITSQWFHDNPLQVNALSNSSVAIESDDCGMVNISGNLIEGDGFGINITRSPMARASGNILRGQRFWETATSGTLATVRGIKMSSCAVAKWIDNIIEDYITPIKSDLGFESIIIGNSLRNSPGTGTTGTLFVDGAIEVASANGATFNAQTATSVLTVNSMTSGTITVGQFVFGTGIPIGTYIVSLGSGTGGAGTYNLSAAVGTIGAEGMVSGFANSHGILIQGNVIENTFGHGILMSDCGGTATAKLQAQIIGNRIKGCQTYAINVIGTDVMVIGNHIEDWDLSNAGTAAIGNSGSGLANGMTIRDNLYIHNVTASKPLCQGSGSTVGYIFEIDGNKSPTGNPLLGTSANGFVTSGTATIASGTTTIAVVFPAPLFRAPTADEITITPTALTTANPGLYWASAITNTGFTFNCFTNPGAGGFPVSYQARIKQPYTV